MYVDLNHNYIINNTDTVYMVFNLWVWVPDHGGEQLDAVQRGDEDGGQDAEFSQQSQPHNQYRLTCV